MKAEDIGEMHIKQFNALFDKHILRNVASQMPPLLFNGFRLQFEDIVVHQPFTLESLKNIYEKRLLPKECRERSTTYGGDCFVKVRLEHNGKILFHGFKPGGLFPIMVGSNLCHLKKSESKNAEKKEFSERQESTEGEKHRSVEIGEDPGECGGYFIVNGHEKLVRFHIAYKRNCIFVVRNRPKDTTYSEYSCFIRSVGTNEIGHKNEVRYCTDGNVHIRLFLYKRSYMLPAVVVLRALVNTTDKEIYEALGEDRRVKTMLSKMRDMKCYSRQECLKFLGERFQVILKIDNAEECGREVLNRTLLVHLERPEDKYNLLIEAIRRLLKTVDGEFAVDNIDSAANHELYTETQLLALCVREKLAEVSRGFYFKILRVLRTRIDTGDSTTSLNTSEVQEVGSEVDGEQMARVIKCFGLLDFGIGHRVAKFLSTGNITTNNCSDILQTTGFTLIAERLNFWRFVSHFQSVSRGAFFASLKISGIRKLRPEGWGFLCPLHTPDGTPCGILLHLAKGCVVSDGNTKGSMIRNHNTGAGENKCNENVIGDHTANQSIPIFTPEIFYEFGLMPILRGHKMKIPLFYNGRLMGSTDDAKTLVTALRRYRSKHGLMVEICHEFGALIYEMIYVSDNIGSLMRRVFNIETEREEWIGMKEQAFLDIKLAKYVTKDRYESVGETTSNAASNITSSIISKGDNTEKYQYVELENSNIFSSVAACIPFADYNPSPRNIYQCQMAKQAMGMPAYSIRYRTDNKLYWVNYLQKPIVRTDAHETMATHPIGTNCVVAVISYTAYDMEDAVIINKSASERGLFSGCIYKTEKFELPRNSTIEYTPLRGQLLREGDLLVRYTDEVKGVCTNKYKGHENAVVDNVRVFANIVPCVTITIRIPRKPNIGDKFCSRHGQKGVLSALWPDADMPFTEQGLRPDIIINPHAFPSRMTIGMLLESMAGKAGVVLGIEQDATPFSKRIYFENNTGNGDNSSNGDNTGINNNGSVTQNNISNNIGEQLIHSGFNYYGNEPMYSGITGNEFKTDIFIGCVYYQRLRHMVNDKFQVRTSGAVCATTHQPVGGRKNKGGIKFGEMERDALISHGAAFMLKDRLMDCSDKTDMLLCETCGTVLFTTKLGCLCGGFKLKVLKMPFVFKYLCCELLAMNIKCKLKL